MVIVVMYVSSHFNNKYRILIGKPEAIVSIDGSLYREQRRTDGKRLSNTHIVGFP